MPSETTAVFKEQVDLKSTIVVPCPVVVDSCVHVSCWYGTYVLREKTSFVERRARSTRRLDRKFGLNSFLYQIVVERLFIGCRYVDTYHPYLRDLCELLSVAEIFIFFGIFDLLIFDGEGSVFAMCTHYTCIHCSSNFCTTGSQRCELVVCAH